MFNRDQNYTGEYTVESQGCLKHNVHQRSELHWGINSGITWSPATQCSTEIRITLGNIQWNHKVA